MQLAILMMKFQIINTSRRERTNEKFYFDRPISVLTSKLTFWHTRVYSFRPSIHTHTYTTDQPHRQNNGKKKVHKKKTKKTQLERDSWFFGFQGRKREQNERTERTGTRWKGECVCAGEVDTKFARSERKIRVGDHRRTNESERNEPWKEDVRVRMVLK